MRKFSSQNVPQSRRNEPNLKVLVSKLVFFENIGTHKKFYYFCIENSLTFPFLFNINTIFKPHHESTDTKTLQSMNESQQIKDEKTVNFHLKRGDKFE